MCKHESQKGPVHHARLKHQEKLDTLVLPREHETKKHAPDLRILLLVCQIWPKASYPKTIIFPVNFFGHILGKTWQNHIYPLSYLSTCPSVYRHDSAWCPTCFSQRSSLFWPRPDLCPSPFFRPSSMALSRSYLKSMFRGM